MPPRRRNTPAHSTSRPTPSRGPTGRRRPLGGAGQRTGRHHLSRWRVLSVQDGFNKAFGSYLFRAAPTRWVDAEGVPPAQIHQLRIPGATVAITEFADQVVLGGKRLRRRLQPGGRHQLLQPRHHRLTRRPSPGLIRSAPRVHQRQAAHLRSRTITSWPSTASGMPIPWPSAQSLLGAGGFNQPLRPHAGILWNGQLAHIASVRVPGLLNSTTHYRSGSFPRRSPEVGMNLNTGGSMVMVLNSAMTSSGFWPTSLPRATTRMRRLCSSRPNTWWGAQGQYEDGIWTYSWPWAIYLMKTGDLALVKAKFLHAGPGPVRPSRALNKRPTAIAADRTGPDGIIGVTKRH